MSLLARGCGALRRVTASHGTSRACASHSDFARVYKASPGTAAQRIASQLSDCKVVLYMKGSPAAPACGFSWKTCQVLDALDVPYKSYNVLDDDELRQGIKAHSAWPTIPQLYVDGEFVGGCDIVEGMARSGELKVALDKAGVVPVTSSASPPK
jgi:monothiol glutaredoxin